MKTSIAELEVKVSGGRIVDATVFEDGTCKLTVQMNECEKFGVVAKTPSVSEDDAFVLVEASKLSLVEKFMRYEPTSNRQREFKKLLAEAIKGGLSDFWRPKLDPSFNEDENGIVFETGKRPAVKKSYNWWEEKAKQYLPERGSRLGTKKEYIAFLGILIKSLVASGWSMSKAWKAVCDDSRELGHYWNSENARHDFEVTGSRKICGFCDLANTCKVLALDEKTGGFWLAGGCCNVNSLYFPLAALCHDTFRDNDCNYGVGWLVLSK